MKKIEATQQKVLFLTFDDGPDPRWTPQILQTLEKYHAHATFFALGEEARKYPDLIKRIRAGNHAVGNHTYDHRSLTGLDDEEVRTELRTGPPSRCFRPPYGSVNDRVRTIAAGFGQEAVLWQVDPRDWARPGTDKIVERVLAGAAPGAIILDHDGGGDRSQTVAAVQRYLPELAKRGYQFRALDCNATSLPKVPGPHKPTSPGKAMGPGKPTGPSASPQR